MFSKFFGVFRGSAPLTNIKQAKTSLPKLKTEFPGQNITKSQSSARVYFNSNYLTPDQIVPSLVKTPAVNVHGDQQGYFKDGSRFPDDKNFFAKIKPGHPTLLSTTERALTPKIMVCSDSLVHAYGGYPNGIKRVFNASQEEVSIYSINGVSFERSYLGPKQFILDQVNHTIEIPEDFQHIYADLPTTYEGACQHIGDNKQGTNQLTRIRLGYDFLARKQSGNFFRTYFKESSAIFLTQAYARHVMEDVALLLHVVNEQAKAKGQKALLKATAVGMGFFAKVDCHYSIMHLLYPCYLNAYKELLANNEYSNIAKVEFPIIKNELMQVQFDNIFANWDNSVAVCRIGRDVVDFSNPEDAGYFKAAVSPADGFAQKGNEYEVNPNASVEASIGNNSTLGFDQRSDLNAYVLKPENHIGIKVIIHPDYKVEYIYSDEVGSENTFGI